MDWTSIGTAIASINAAKELAGAMIGVRDFNESAAAIAKINEQLLAAQQGLLTHNSMLLQLQQEHFQATEELRKLKEAAAEKQRYVLFEISPGEFVYRVDVPPQERGASEPGRTEPVHHICQPCFDTSGRKSVLQQRVGGLYCTICRNTYGPSSAPLGSFTSEFY